MLIVWRQEEGAQPEVSPSLQDFSKPWRRLGLCQWAWGVANQDPQYLLVDVYS